MRKLAAAIALWLVLAAPAFAETVGPANDVLCNKIATLAAGPTSITQVIAAVTNQRVFICGWHITNTGATGTFSFQNGTGSNCGTNTVTIIPAQNVTSTAPSADHEQFATFDNPISAAFCITPSVATIAGIIYYAQF